MKWFKFYGQDFLTDSKLMDMNWVDRYLWVILLCLASTEEKDGLIPRLTEEKLFRYANLQDPKHIILGKGIFQRLIDNKMITNDNGVRVINFKKRQNKHLSGYERLKRYRDKKRLNRAIKNDNVDNTMITLSPVINDNARIDKSREDITEQSSEISSSKKDPSITSSSKKQRMNKYNEASSSDTYEPSIDLDSRELTDPTKVEKGGIDKYKAMIAWAAERRGFPFVAVLKQYAAFKQAKKSGITPERLQERWIEFETDAFRKKVGWDWMDVVTSFNKKQ